MAKAPPDPMEAIRDKLRQAAKASGMTMEEIGLRMGASAGGAKQTVSRLLSATAESDPRLSTLLAFADAIRRPLRDIL